MRPPVSQTLSASPTEGQISRYIQTRGFEAFAGPIGIRAEVGDDIYFDHGAHNNLKVSFGPQLRF
jgi:hypothetical protein